MAKKYAPCWLDEEGLSDGLFKVLRKMAVLYQTEREILQIISLHPERVPSKHHKELYAWVDVKKMTVRLADINAKITSAEQSLSRVREDLAAVKNERFDRFMKDLKAVLIKHDCKLDADHDGHIVVSRLHTPDPFEFQVYENGIG